MCEAPAKATTFWVEIHHVTKHADVMHDHNLDASCSTNYYWWSSGTVFCELLSRGVSFLQQLAVMQLVFYNLFRNLTTVRINCVILNCDLWLFPSPQILGFWNAIEMATLYSGPYTVVDSWTSKNFINVQKCMDLTVYSWQKPYTTLEIKFPWEQIINKMLKNCCRLTVISFPRLIWANFLFMPSPLPSSQIAASAGWVLKGQSLTCSSYQIVLRDKHTDTKP